MFCAYTRLRFQVSVYRTIGPLVSAFVRELRSNGISCLHLIYAVLFHLFSLFFSYTLFV